MTRRELLQTFAGTPLAMMAAGATDAAARGGIDYGPTGANILRRPPASDGFRFAAEWAVHERTVMQFLLPQNWPPPEAGIQRQRHLIRFLP